MEKKEALLNHLRSLNEVSNTLMQCQSLEELIQKALAEVRLRLEVQVASIFLFNKDGNIQRVGIEGIDKDGNPIDNSWLSDEHYQPGESFSGRAVPPTGEAAYGEPQYSNNISLEYAGMKYEVEYQETLGELRCGISVPLNGLNRTFGTLEVLNKQSLNSFDYDALYWLMLIGTKIADLVSNFRRKEKQKIYNEITQKLILLEDNQKDFNLKMFCQYIADIIIFDFTSFKACIIHILTEREVLDIHGKSATSDISLEGRVDASVQTGSRIVGEVYRSKESRFIKDVEEEIDKFNNKPWILKQKLKSFACLPLAVNNQCVGTISVYTGYRHEFSDSNKEFLENIAFLTAAIISRFQIICDLRQIRKERNQIREAFLNASVLVQSDRISQEILHQSKNEFINLYQALEKLSTDSIKSRDKEQLIREKKEWIARRIKEIEKELSTDEQVSVDINQAIEEAIKSLSFDFSYVNVEFKADNTIPVIAIDEKIVKNIVFNLLSNAEKAIEEAQIKKQKKEGKIFITTEIVTLERIQYIQIAVEDNGSGIDHEIRNRIFERGFTTRAKEGGTGFGLFTASEIIKKYGGRIYFDSTVDRGTKFFVQIPLKRYML